MDDITKRVVALDPGGTTGWALWQSKPLQPNPGPPWDHITCGQIGPQAHHADLYAFLEFQRTHNFTIVSESFEFRQGQQRAGINLMSREYIGVARLFGQLEDVPVVLQTAGQGKAFVTDEKLKIMGLWVPGQKHARDALRHLITYLVQKERMTEYIESWKNL